MKKTITAAVILAVLTISLGLAARSVLTLPKAYTEVITAETVQADATLKDAILRRSAYAVQLCCDHSLTVSPLPNEDMAMWFEIKSTDPLVKGSNRAEMRFLSSQYDRAFGYDATTYVPADWAADDLPFIFMQWHGSKDRFMGEKGRVPPLELNIHGDDIVVLVAHDAAIMSDSKNIQQKEIGRFPLVRGDVMAWQIDVVWTWKNDGRVRVRLNGDVMVDYTGPTAHRDLVGPYFKFGAYSPKWKKHPERPDTTRKIAFTSASVRPGEL